MSPTCLSLQARPLFFDNVAQFDEKLSFIFSYKFFLSYNLLFKLFFLLKYIKLMLLNIYFNNFDMLK
jgi:hypothetical protein